MSCSASLISVWVLARIRHIFFVCVSLHSPLVSWRKALQEGFFLGGGVQIQPVSKHFNILLFPEMKTKEERSGGFSQTVRVRPGLSGSRGEGGPGWKVLRSEQSSCKCIFTTSSSSAPQEALSCTERKKKKKRQKGTFLQKDIWFRVNPNDHAMIGCVWTLSRGGCRGRPV